MLLELVVAGVVVRVGGNGQGARADAVDAAVTAVMHPAAAVEVHWINWPDPVAGEEVGRGDGGRVHRPPGACGVLKSFYKILVYIWAQEVATR